MPPCSSSDIIQTLMSQTDLKRRRSVIYHRILKRQSTCCCRADLLKLQGKIKLQQSLFIERLLILDLHVPATDQHLNSNTGRVRSGKLSRLKFSLWGCVEPLLEYSKNVLRTGPWGAFVAPGPAFLRSWLRPWSQTPETHCLRSRFKTIPSQLLSGILIPSYNYQQWVRVKSDMGTLYGLLDTLHGFGVCEINSRAHSCIRKRCVMAFFCVSCLEFGSCSKSVVYNSWPAADVISCH